MKSLPLRRRREIVFVDTELRKFASFAEREEDRMKRLLLYSFLAKTLYYKRCAGEGVDLSAWCRRSAERRYKGVGLDGARTGTRNC